ncbi:cyanobactin maturation protease PatG family protein [Streptomyces sp. NPDC001591]|uniref:cyanobactin maturation protease PatG family protein n=1 Tax=Streptomyces sp. NPDC001591 TaxID=3364589 RepID=UPI0036CB06B0
MDTENVKEPTKGSVTAEGCGCGAGHDGPSERTAPAPPSFVYAIGRIDFQCRDRGVERELAQSMRRTDTAWMTDREALCEVLTQPENRYLTRQLCYVLSIQGLDTYVLVPRVADDFALLAEAVRPSHQADALDVVIGVREGLAHTGYCNGLQLPVVTFDQLYSASTSYLVQSIERPESMDAEQFDKAAADLLNTVLSVSGNVGASDEHRALTYLMVRNPAIYRKTFAQSMDGFSLTSIDVRRSNLSGARQIMDVVFTYSSRRTDEVEKYFVPVDVTNEFPFPTGPLGTFYDHG